MIKPQSYNEFGRLESRFPRFPAGFRRSNVKKIPELAAANFVYHGEVMAFCTNCGSQVSDGARFCANCGTPMGALDTSMPGVNVPALPPEPLKYDIEGHNLQIARVHLAPGQEVFAEAGKRCHQAAAHG
jgi:hypothetical protein